MMNAMHILLWANPMPETPEFTLPGFGRAGNLAQRGIAEGLYGNLRERMRVLGFQSLQAWPRYGQKWISSKNIEYDSGLAVTLLSSPNVLFVRELWRGVSSFFHTLRWCWRLRGQKRCVLIYNLYTPLFCFVQAAVWLTKTPVVPIIFDIGMPPGTLGWLRDRIYRALELMSKVSLRNSDGVCVIVDNIQKKYHPAGHALRVDGGVSPEILSRLFDLRREEIEGKEPVTTFMFAGSIARHNGIDLLLDALKLLPRTLGCKVVIAGSGCQSDKLKKAAEADPRIVLAGMLDLDELFQYYRKSDVLLNLRLTKELDTSTWFPSKFIEAMACGRLVLSTNVAHLKDVYGKFCMVLEDETPQGLADMMQSVISMGRSARDDFGKRARSYMLKSHTWNSQADRIIRYCEKIVKGDLSSKRGVVDV